MKTNKYYLSFLFVITTLLVFSQAHFTLQGLHLPTELSGWKNQFSGLFSYKDRLFLLSESRAELRAGAWYSDEAKFYSLLLSDLDNALADSTYKFKETRLDISGLEEAKEKMRAAGNIYEGLEAFFIENDTVYLAVETAPDSPECYLLRGKLKAGSVDLDGSLVALPKPKKEDGKFVYNAGFEALMKTGNTLFAFYECNYFSLKNEVCQVACSRFAEAQPLAYVTVEKIPFRLTDITSSGKNKFTAINSFYKDEPEHIYRGSPNDTPNYSLIRTDTGYRSYSRLIELTLTSNGLTWAPLWEFPPAYWGCNWEGLAAHNNGYFVINDTYTPQGKRTVLVYLKKE